jgi:hypothetical protein
LSQIYKTVASTPSVATTYHTQNGDAVPAANILNIYAADTNEDNDNGIRTIGSGNTVTVQLTNRITGTVTTTDATPTVLVTVSLGATPGVYLVTGDVTAYNTTDSAGASYTFEGAATTTGLVGTEIGNEQKNQFEQAAMADADFELGVSGNNAVITVTGIALKTINWSCLFNYRFVG